MKKKNKKYNLKAVKSSKLPTRGMWKARVAEIIDQFDNMPERHIEVENIESKKELQALYDAFKAFIRRNNLKLEVMTEEGKLYLSKDMRYFVK